MAPPIAKGAPVRYRLIGQHWTGTRWEQVHEGLVVAYVPAWTNVAPHMPPGMYEAHKWPFYNRSSKPRYLVLCGKGTYYRCPAAALLERQNPGARRAE